MQGASEAPPAKQLDGHEAELGPGTPDGLDEEHAWRIRVRTLT